MSINDVIRYQLQQCGLFDSQIDQVMERCYNEIQEMNGRWYEKKRRLSFWTNNQLMGIS